LLLAAESNLNKKKITKTNSNINEEQNKEKPNEYKIGEKKENARLRMG
jgi:hypothetical protein